MRLIVGALIVFAGIIGYGAYRQRQAKLVQIERAAAVADSLERVDSLQRIAEIDAAAPRQGPRPPMPSQIAVPESRPPAR